MGARLSFFRGSVTITKPDDKEGSQEVKPEVTPLTPSQPTPIPSESGTEDKQSKCRCADCKCDPCNCCREALTHPTNELPESKTAEPVTQEEAKLTENVEIQKADEVIVPEEPSKEVAKIESPQESQPEVPQREVSEAQESKPEESQVSSEAECQPTQEEVKGEPSADAASENKCLCSPCECNPCKCGPHEVNTEAQVIQSEGQTQESEKEPTESEPSNERPVEETNSEPKIDEVKELTEADQQIVDNPQVNQELVAQNEQ